MRKFHPAFLKLCIVIKPHNFGKRNHLMSNPHSENPMRLLTEHFPSSGFMTLPNLCSPDTENVTGLLY